MPKTNRRKIKVSISISEVIWQLTKQLAKRFGKSYSDIAEEAISRYLEQFSLLTEKAHEK